MTTLKTQPSSKPSRRPHFVSIDGRLTVEQWEAMPDTKPRYELVDGQLVQKMTTTNAHAWAAGELLFALKSGSRESGLGWRFMPEGTSVHLDEFNGSVPDVVGFSPNQILQPLATYNDVPFLVAEVLSRSTAKRDRTTKQQYYAAVDVQLYLIVDPQNRTMEIFRLDGQRYGSPEVLGENDVWQPQELPDLPLEVARLWM